MKLSIFLALAGCISAYTISAVSHRSQLKASKFIHKSAVESYEIVEVPKLLSMRRSAGRTRRQSSINRFNRFRSHHRARC